MVKQERAARTREALIRAAAATFRREGHVSASLSTISAQAGVSNGALHFHFASKADLAHAVEEAALCRLTAVMSPGNDVSTGPLQLLVNVSHGLVRGLRQDDVLRAGFSLAGEPDRDPVHDLHAHWQQWIAQTLMQAQLRGELAAGVDRPGAVSALVAATVGFEVLGSRDSAWLAPSTMTQLWELLLPRLAAEGHRASVVPHGGGA